MHAGSLRYSYEVLIFTKPRKEPHSASVTIQRPHDPLPPPTTFTRCSPPGFMRLFANFSALFSPRPASFLLSNSVFSSCSSLSSSSSMLAKRTCFFLATLSRTADEDMPGDFSLSQPVPFSNRYVNELLWVSEPPIWVLLNAATLKLAGSSETTEQTEECQLSAANAAAENLQMSTASSQYTATGALHR